MHKKEAEKQSPWETVVSLKNRLLLPVKFMKCLSLCLIIQSEVKGLKVFPEAASQHLLLFLADLTLPPVRLVRNIKDGFTGQYLPAEKSKNGQYQPEAPSSLYSTPARELSSASPEEGLPILLTLFIPFSLAQSVISTILSESYSS